MVFLIGKGQKMSRLKFIKPPRLFQPKPPKYDLPEEILQYIIKSQPAIIVESADFVDENGNSQTISLNSKKLSKNHYSTLEEIWKVYYSNVGPLYHDNAITLRKALYLTLIREENSMYKLDLRNLVWGGSEPIEFLNTNAAEVKLDSSYFDTVNFYNCNLRDASFVNCEIRRLSFSGTTNLGGIRIKHAEIQSCHVWDSCKLSWTSLPLLALIVEYRILQSKPAQERLKLKPHEIDLLQVYMTSWKFGDRRYNLYEFLANPNIPKKLKKAITRALIIYKHLRPSYLEDAYREYN